MAREERFPGPHVLAVPYPSQGHVNPMLQFCKRLASKGLTATLAITNFISSSMRPKSSTVRFDTISDGYDLAGFSQAESINGYLSSLQEAGSRTLAELIRKYGVSGQPVHCVIYDAFLPWALDVAKEFGLIGVSFFTQPCAVNFVYYNAYHGLFPLPVPSSPTFIPGLPLLELEDMPSFIYVHGSYPSYFELVLNQFLNVDMADYVFVNTFYELEAEVVDEMSKISPFMTIGPTIPSSYLDQQLQDDFDYGLHLFQLEASTCIDWLATKPKGSVVYVSFGSMANLSKAQMEELAWGLRGTSRHFIWVVRESEWEKIPEGFVGSSDKGLIVKWGPQVEILSREAVGCFLSHCGWNSTIEALSLGVPMVVMPQWTDQTTNAKFVQDVWKVGLRVKVGENGLVGRDELEGCVREVMEGERGIEMKRNATKWQDLAKAAVVEGGSSDKNMNEFASKLMNASR